MTKTEKEQKVLEVELDLSKKPGTFDTGKLKNWIEKHLNFLPEVARKRLLDILEKEK